MAYIFIFDAIREEMSKEAPIYFYPLSLRGKLLIYSCELSTNSCGNYLADSHPRTICGCTFFLG